VLDGAPAPEDGPQGFEAVREGGEEETRKRHEAETWRETRGWGMKLDERLTFSAISSSIFYFGG